MTLFIAIAVGFLLAAIIPQLDIREIPVYEFVLYTLLAIGLYGAVYGIELKEFHNHKPLLFRAITFGVLLKSILIGSAFWFVFQSPYAFLFGIIVAQIDPLSVAHLIDNKSNAFSNAGRTILRAWSSFDDPMTVLLALYVFLPLAVPNGISFTLWDYLLQLGSNILFASIIYAISKRVSSNSAQLALLGLAFLIAIPLKLMLGIALVGLFVRPTIKQISQIIQLAFVLAAVVLGSLLTITATILIQGMVIGVAAYVAQIIVTFIVAPSISKKDKLFLAFAQYNGITSIILALIIAQWVPEVVSIIAVAVIVINLLYFVCNSIVEKRLGKN